MVSKASALVRNPDGGIVMIGRVFVDRTTGALYMGEVEVRIVFSSEQAEAFAEPHRAELGENYEELIRAARRHPWPHAANPPKAVRITGQPAQVLVCVVFMDTLNNPDVRATESKVGVFFTNQPPPAGVTG